MYRKAFFVFLLLSLVSGCIPGDDDPPSPIEPEPPDTTIDNHQKGLRL
jgi:hypothetical protein